MTFDEGQVSSFLKHGGSYAAGAFTIIAGFGVIDHDHAVQAIAAINDVVNGLSQATAGVGKIVVILGPAAATVMGWLASHNVGFGPSLKRVVEQAKASPSIAPDSPKQELLAATASLPEVAKVVPVDPRIAEINPSEKVTAS